MVLREALLFLFLPDRWEAEFCPLPPDQHLVNRVAAHLDCTEAAVVEYAAKHVDVDYTMDDFYVKPVLPWQVRQFIRDNIPLTLHWDGYILTE